MSNLRAAIWWGITLLLLSGWGCSKAPLPTEPDEEVVEKNNNLSKITVIAADYSGQAVDSADVYWNGEFLGLTPLIHDGVVSGIHSLRVQKTGYELFTETVEIIPTQPAFFEAMLKKMPLNKGQLIVTVDRDSVTTTLSDHNKNIIDLFYEREKSYVLNPGGYFIKAERPGFRIFHVAFEVKIDSIIVKNIHLEKLQNTELPDIILAVADSGTVNFPVTISWESSNAEKVDIDYITGAGLNGKREVTFQTSGMKYIRAIAYNNIGSATYLDSTFISDPVKDPLLPPKISIAVLPKKIFSNQSATIRWQSSNAQSVSVDYVPGAGLSGAWQVTFDAPGIYPVQAHAYGPGGSATDVDTLVVEMSDLPNPPVVERFVVSPDSIVQGETATLQWTVSGENPTVFIDQGVGQVGPTGNLNVSPSSNTVYTLTAINSGGTVTRTVNLKVGQQEPPPTPLPTIALNVNPREVGINQDVTLYWESRNANSVSVDFVPQAGLSGQYLLRFSTAGEYVITATAHGDGGEASDSDTVKVHSAEAPWLEFNATPKVAEYGSPISISWSSNGYQVIIDQSIGIRGPQGSEEVYFENPGTKIFTAVAYGENQLITTARDTVFIEEPEQPQLPVIWLAVVDSVEVGKPALVEWQTQNAQQVDVDFVQLPGLNGKAEIIFNSEGKRIITATAYNPAGQVTVADTVEVVSGAIQQQVMPIYIPTLATVAAIHPTVPTSIENAGQTIITHEGYYQVKATVWYNSGDYQKNESFYLTLNNNGRTVLPENPNAGIYKVVVDNPGAPHVIERNAGVFYLRPGQVNIAVQHYFLISNLYPQFIVDGPIDGPESVTILSFRLEYFQP